MRSYIPHVAKVGSRNRGFSLIELMVSMAIFLLVSASVFILFSQQQTSASVEQGVVGLNIGIRNAMSQLQLDLANAGSANFAAGYNIPTWPIGVTIVNNVQQAGTSCYTPGTGTTPGTYGQNCFDQLNILEPDTTVPPISVTNSTGGSGNCPATNVPGGGPAAAYGMAANGLPPIATIGYFHNGDQLLFLKSDGSKMTSVVLTQAPTVYPANQPVVVQFTFNSTNSDGSNTTGTNFNVGSNTVANDPLDIAACGGYPCPTTALPGPPRVPAQAAYLSDSFCGGDWIFRLAPIVYYVNNSNPNDPQLMRQQGTNNAVPVMDQVIGFKVGAAIWNSVNDNSTWGTSYYFYDASTYNIKNPVNTPTGLANPPDSPYLFPFIRSVRVSLIGRTQPNPDPSFTFRNAFDGGHYMVQGASVIVSPRNLSMSD